MPLTDIISDFLASISIAELHAEAPAEDKDDDAEAGDKEEGGESEGEGDSEGGDEGGEDEGGEDAEEEEEEDDDEPVDPKPKLEAGTHRYALTALHIIFAVIGGSLRHDTRRSCTRNSFSCRLQGFSMKMIANLSHLCRNRLHQKRPM